MALNRPTKAALNTTEKVLDRVLCVIGAVLFSQGPEFMQQYLQRLGGFRDGLQSQLAQYQGIASQTGQTFEQFVATTKGNAVEGVAKLGGVMESTAARVAELTAAEAAIREASPWMRPVQFIRYFDSSIAHSTWTVFKPAIPTTFEGALYAGIGVLFALGFYYGFVRLPVARVYARRQAAKLAAAAKPAATAKAAT